MTWVSAIFIGPALGLNWLFGAAIAVSIIIGSLTRKGRQDGDREERHERRRMVRDEMRERRRELRHDDR